MTNNVLPFGEAVRRYSRDGMQYAGVAALPVGAGKIRMRMK